MHEFEKLSDKAIRKMEREARKLQRQFELDQRNTTIAAFVKIMRDNGAGEPTIQKALPGISELVKFSYSAIGGPLPLIPSALPSSHDPDNPENTTSPVPIEGILGLFLSEIQSRPVQWLWQQRIPLSKITILDGDPGIGKSLLAIHIAACITTGQPLPGGVPSAPRSVIIIAPEDGANDTLRPRLEAAGGDPACVLLLNTIESLDTAKARIGDRPFSLSQDLDQLEEAIKRTAAALVILDPLTAVLGHRTDAARDQDIREVFTPLAQMAERTNCAILVIRHLSKSASTNALYRGAGSIGIIAAARTALIITPHPYEEGQYILATTKNNLSIKASNLTYRIVANHLRFPFIQWLGSNNYPLPTLLDSGTNLSIERQEILQALKDANGPLGPREIAELTGQKYTSVKQNLYRMHQARHIIRLHRGLYITHDHPSLPLHKDTDSHAETTDTIDTSVTCVTTENPH